MADSAYGDPPGTVKYPGVSDAHPAVSRRSLNARGVDGKRWLTGAEKDHEVASFAEYREDQSHYRTAHPEAKGGEGWVDPEVLPLVDALNQIEGVCTIQSCCGHRYPVDGGEAVHRGQLWLRLSERVMYAASASVADLLCHSVIARVTRQFAFDSGMEPEEVFDVLFEPGRVEEAQAVLVPFFRECSASAYRQQALEGLAERLEGTEPLTPEDWLALHHASGHSPDAACPPDHWSGVTKARAKLRDHLVGLGLSDEEIERGPV